MTETKHVLVTRSQKGGAGKSTMALLLALGATRAGRKPLIVDLDVGGTELYLAAALITMPEEPVTTVHDWLTEPAGLGATEGAVAALEFRFFEEGDTLRVLPTYPLEGTTAARADRRQALQAFTACDTPYLQSRISGLLKLCLKAHDVVILDLEPFSRALPSATFAAVRDLATKARCREIWVMLRDVRDEAASLVALAAATIKDPKEVVVDDAQKVHHSLVLNSPFTKVGQQRPALMDVVQEDTTRLKQMLDIATIDGKWLTEARAAVDDLENTGKLPTCAVGQLPFLMSEYEDWQGVVPNATDQRRAEEAADTLWKELVPPQND